MLKNLKQECLLSDFFWTCELNFSQQSRDEQNESKEHLKRIPGGRLI